MNIWDRSDQQECPQHSQIWVWVVFAYRKLGPPMPLLSLKAGPIYGIPWLCGSVRYWSVSLDPPRAPHCCPMYGRWLLYCLGSVPHVWGADYCIVWVLCPMYGLWLLYCLGSVSHVWGADYCIVRVLCPMYGVPTSCTKWDARVVAVNCSLLAYYLYYTDWSSRCCFICYRLFHVHSSAKSSGI